MLPARACLLVTVALASACAGGGSQPPSRTETTRPATYAESVSAEACWEHLVRQCSFGPRAHGMSGHRKTREYIRQQLEASGARVREIELAFQGSEDRAPKPFWNITGRFGPEEGPWVLVGSHYDTRLWADEDPDRTRRNEPIEGANDGASGIAVMLELARLLGERPPSLGVELVFFDGEDYGRRGSPDYFVGSRDLAANWEKWYSSKPECAVVLDMVGDADLQYRREATAHRNHAWLNDHLWRTARSLGHGAVVADGYRSVVDDHTALLDIGIPATLLIDFDFPHWHTVEDTSDKCSAESLAVTARIVAGALLDQPLPPR